MTTCIGMTEKTRHRYPEKFICLLICLMMACVILLPFSAGAQDAEPKVVRVGWFDSSFCYWDQFGRRCGIDYEYQQKISAYTGWTYEYVEDSWPNLLQKLINGEIDLLSDVSYKEERAEYILYPDLPMGTETYYIYISSDNRDITANDLDSFNGRRIGVNQGSVQEGFLMDWAEKNRLDIEVVPMTMSEDDAMNLLTRGRIDGIASIYSYGSEQKITPVCRIGGSDYYYAVNKNRPDLLAELNMALSGIHEEDPYFNERLSEERIYDARIDLSLTPEESDWLAGHETIRVGYVENYLPFCQINRDTDELTGALKDFLTHAENNLRDTDTRFEPVPYASTAAALEGMKAGETDCIFPVNLNMYDAEQREIRLTSPAMKTGMNAVMRDSDDLSLSRDSSVAIAVSEGSLNIDTFVMEQYPDCRRLVFANEEECFKAAASGLADCMLISNYRIPGAQQAIDQYKLYHVPTGEHIQFSFAVNRDDRALYFILNKIVLTTRSEDMDSALASYMHPSRKVSFMDFLRDNWIAVIVFLTVVFLVIVFLLLQRLKAQRKAHEQQRLLEEAAEIAELKQTITSLLDNIPGINCTKDAKTGVYLACNQGFAEYAGQKDPSGVIGRTDEEIFDAETAKRLTEDDRIALSMDEPYTFFEEVQDASGKNRQMKTTKLKYMDATGRLCVLGIRQDASDAVRIHRRNATTKESYEKARGTGIIYTHIAQALARGYSELYYIDLNTEEFIEYRTDAADDSLTEARRGWHFFEQCQEEIDELIYPEDREAVKKAMDRKTLTAALEQNNTFMTTFRRIGEQGPVYMNMRVTRIPEDERYIVLGVMNIDEQARQRSASMRMKEEQTAYNRIRALAGDFFCIYIVVPETGRYRKLSTMAGFEFSAGAAEGTDFFTDFREQSRIMLYPEDQNRVLTILTRENILGEVERHGIFTLSYRLMMKGKPRYVRLKAVMVEEEQGCRLIAGINDIEAQVRQEEDYVSHLAKARIEANVDALTGVKNRHAYLMAEERLNNQIAEDPARKFAIVILDINDLKQINDTDGHNAGDQYIRDACRIICNTFKHSPVFRLGGDEFAVIAQGDDYACIDELIQSMQDRNEEAIRNGGIVIACGMARREDEDAVAAVFERADQRMYENKNLLKNQ